MGNFFSNIFIKIIFFVVLVVFSSFLFYSCGEDSSPIVDPNTPTEPILQTTAIDISDGDTFSIYYKNQKWKVRVLYVDCFETSKGNRLTEQARKAGISVDSALALGLKAKEFAKKTLLNKKVELHRDYKEPNLDTYGRLLRVTYIEGKRYDSLLKVLGLAVPE
ncbi:MAG: thermonuclease family protein [Ignavibacteria bacterium]|nr:thermonuclease family protein [Ignavibacteria bacterium]